MSGNSDDTVVPRDGEFTALQPVVEGTPAQFMPAQYTPATPAIPAQPLQPLQPAQYMPATPGIPAETVQGTPLLPLLPREGVETLPELPEGRLDAMPLAPMQEGEREEALPLGTTTGTETPRYLDREPAEQTEPRFYKSTGPDDSTPRFYKSTGPDDATPRLDDEAPDDTTPRFYKSTGPDDSTPRAYKSTGPDDATPRLDDARQPVDGKPALLDRELAKQPAGTDDPPPSGSDNPPPSGSDDTPPSGSDDPPSTTTGSGSGSGSVYVDTDKLAQAVPGFDGIMRQMYSIANGTSNALDGFQLDRGDSYGEAYVNTANPISTQILGGLSSAAGVFGDTAEGTGLMVHNYNITEDNAAASASELTRSSEA
jgi:hypothetical protein